MRQPDVLIVGAGPTGLTLASELLRSGVRNFRLIDQSTGPNRFSRAGVLHARARELLWFTGARALIEREGHPMLPQKTVAYGRTIGYIDSYGVDGPARGSWILNQRKIEERLIEHLAAKGAVVERNTALKMFEPDGGGVTATLLRPDGCEEFIYTRYIVGADGSNSLVRKIAGIPYDGEAYDQTDFFIADVHLPDEFPNQGISTLNRNGTKVLFFPQEGIYRLIVSRPRQSQSNDNPTLADLQEIVDRCGPPGARMRDPQWITRFGCDRRLARTYRQGPVLLAGDAAHLHVPLGGQGANTGIADAMNLGWKLGAVICGHAEEKLLDSYDAERRPIGDRLVNTIDRMLGQVRLPSWSVVWRARIIGPIAFRLPFVQRRIRNSLSQMWVEYRDSPIVSELRARSGTPKPGQRAPDGILLKPGSGMERHEFKERHAFDLFAEPGHTLLVFAGKRVAVRPQLQRLAETFNVRHAAFGKAYLILCERPSETNGLSAPPILLDATGRFSKAYRVKAPIAVLIRPDGYIALACEAPTLEKVEQFVAARYGYRANTVATGGEAYPSRQSDRIVSPESVLP